MNYSRTDSDISTKYQEIYLQEIEAVRSAAGIFLDWFNQVFSIFYLTAAKDFSHVDGHLLIAPVQLIDVCVVAALHTFVSVLRPGW